MHSLHTEPPVLRRCPRALVFAETWFKKDHKFDFLFNSTVVGENRTRNLPVPRHTHTHTHTHMMTITHTGHKNLRHVHTI
jgi:hypothetical protein